MHDEDIVCTCMSVSVRDIKTAIEAGVSAFRKYRMLQVQVLSVERATMYWKPLSSNY